MTDQRRESKDPSSVGMSRRIVALTVDEFRRHQGPMSTWQEANGLMFLGDPKDGGVALYVEVRPDEYDMCHPDEHDVCRGQWCCGCESHPIGKPWGWNIAAWEHHYSTAHADEPRRVVSP